jgi:hypothetical protein
MDPDDKILKHKGKKNKIIAIKQFFQNKKMVFCIGGCETNFWIFP